MTLRLATLYLRSRLAGVSLAVIAAAAVLTWLALRRTDDPVSTVLLLIAAPLGPAVIVAAGAGSPFGEIERTASRALLALRLGHLAGLLVWAGLALALAGTVEPAAGSVWMLARNGAGYAGLALLGARLAGAGLSWLPALAYGGGVCVAKLREMPSDVWWLWPLPGAADGSAAVLALALLVAGLGTVVFTGAREETGEVT